jgi:outer membrane cobalamin receptor
MGVGSSTVYGSDAIGGVVNIAAGACDRATYFASVSYRIE